MPDIFSHLSYGFIGAGSLCQALLQGFLHKTRLPKERFFLSSRNLSRLNKVAERFSVRAVSGNEELVAGSQLVFLCIKPEDLVSVIEPLSNQFNQHHTLISFLAGVPLSELKKLLPQVNRLVRVVPNTAASVGEGIFAYSLDQSNSGLEAFIEELFSPLGPVLKMREENLSAFTVAASSGLAFVLEFMQYWNEWLENHQFSPQLARQISTQTFLGASLLAKEFPKKSLSHLQLQVASKRGMTAEGLKSLNEAQMDSILHYAFERCALREKALRKE